MKYIGVYEIYWCLLVSVYIIIDDKEDLGNRSN